MQSYADMLVVGEADNGVEAVAMADALLPDVVIMDVNMPKMNGVQATGQIKARHPSMVVIGFSMHDDSRYEQGMKTAGPPVILRKTRFQIIYTTSCVPAAQPIGGKFRIRTMS